MKKWLFLITFLFLVGIVSAEGTYLFYEEDYDRTVETVEECNEDSILVGLVEIGVCEDENFCTIEYNSPECLGSVVRQTTKEKTCVPCEYGCYDKGCYNKKVSCPDLTDCRMYEDEVFIYDDITFGVDSLDEYLRNFKFNANNRRQSIQKEEGLRQRLHYGDLYTYYITITDIKDDYIVFDLDREKVTEEVVIDCEESDYGDRPYEYGELDSGKKDFCKDEDTLIEYYCDKTGKEDYLEKSYGCNHGCREGECLGYDEAKKIEEEKKELEKKEAELEELKREKEYYDYNNGDQKRPVKVEDLREQDCNGCVFGDQCFPYGYRKDGNYCSDEESFLSYKEAGEICENNFECDSNVCVNGECIDGGFINRVLNWFRQVFGEE